MLRWTVIGILVLTMLVVVVSAQAQTTTSTGPTAPAASTPPGTTAPPAPTAGAFESLSPGGQKIARALFEAQTTTPPPGSTGGTGTTTTAPKPLTLDEIAAKKQAGTGWGRVFKDLKAQGLVQEKNLGQVVSRYQHQHRPHAGRGVVTTGSGRESREHRGYARRHGGDDDRTEHGRLESDRPGRWEHGRRESGSRGESAWKGEPGRGAQSFSSGTSNNTSSGRSWAGTSEPGRGGGGHGGGRGK